MIKHKLHLTKTIYSDGLRIIECDDCRYAFAVEFDAGQPQMTTRININQGDINAIHTLFLVPKIDLEFNVEVDHG